MVELSVLIPTYNRADSLDRVLDSLNNQTYQKSFQCIIADNCSSDHTKSVVEKWKSKDKNFIQKIKRDTYNIKKINKLGTDNEIN